MYNKYSRLTEIHRQQSLETYSDEGGANLQISSFFHVSFHVTPFVTRKSQRRAKGLISQVSNIMLSTFHMMKPQSRIFFVRWMTVHIPLEGFVASNDLSVHCLAFRMVQGNKELLGEGNISKDWWSSPDRRMCWCWEKCRDMRCDARERQLHEDLTEISQN
jgi:hypothetical protein